MGRPSLGRFDGGSGSLRPVEGARDDDVVCDVSRDGTRLLLRSADPVVVRGHSRSRISVVAEGVAGCATERMHSVWGVFEPGGRLALVGSVNAAGRPVVMDAATCEAVGLGRVGVDARFGEVDPLEGGLWVPDRGEGAVVCVDCATGGTTRVKLGRVKLGGVKLGVGGVIVRVRFARDGGSLLVVGRRGELGEGGTLSRHRRDGSVMWVVDVSDVAGAGGGVGAGDIFLNGNGSHVLFSFISSRNSEWGEDLVFGMASGALEGRRVRHRGPPARLMADWFGDHVLTYAGEVVEFFTGRVVGRLAVG